MNHPDHAPSRMSRSTRLSIGWHAADFLELLEEGLSTRGQASLHSGSDKPDSSDITDTIEAKIAALKEHKSQVGHWDVAERMKEWARDQGKEHG
jgi:LmbE family N-acetylglucosaminyl deacetylase